MCDKKKSQFNPIALRMAKTPLSFGHSGCNRIKFPGTENCKIKKDIVFQLIHLSLRGHLIKVLILEVMLL